MNETIQIYVKATSNCEGMPLQTFELLSSTWTGDKIRLPFGALWDFAWNCHIWGRSD